MIRTILKELNEFTKMQFVNSHRTYGSSLEELIASKEECPVSQEVFSEHPLGIYCLYGADSKGKLHSQYFDTDYLYKWLKNCKDTPGKIATNPLTREEIDDDIFKRIEKYFLLKSDCPDLKRSEQSSYLEKLLDDVKKGKELYSNVIYKSIISAETLQLDFLDHCSKDAEIKKIAEETGYREAAYKILENAPMGSWLARPSSLVGDESIIPIVLTRKVLKREFVNTVLFQKRGVGILVPKNQRNLLRGDNILNCEFDIDSDLFIEFVEKSDNLLLNKYYKLDVNTFMEGV